MLRPLFLHWPITAEISTVPSATLVLGSARLATPRVADTAVLDMIETGVLTAIGRVGASIVAARGEVSAAQSGLPIIRTQKNGLAPVAREANAASIDLTKHTDALPVTTARSGEEMHHAAGRRRSACRTAYRD